jgi:hypothetical protein
LSDAATDAIAGADDYGGILTPARSPSGEARWSEVDGFSYGMRASIWRELDARQTDTEQALTGVWQGRLQQLLLDDPAVAGELRGSLMTSWRRC